MFVYIFMSQWSPWLSKFWEEKETSESIIYWSGLRVALPYMPTYGRTNAPVE